MSDPISLQTITEYGAGTSDTTRWVKVKSQIDADHWKEGYTYFDGLSRTVRTQSVDDAGDVFVITCYDNMGRTQKSTNPFRGYSNQTCSTTTGLDWTTNTYDAAGRLSTVIVPDSSVVTNTYGLATSAPIGTIKTVTDQAGKKRKGITDVLGRMLRVIEDPDSSALSTDYTFDTLGNLRKTAQGTSQSRYFMYDALGRLQYAKQIEQDTNSNFSATDPVTGNTAWSTKYEYDANSNITKTTDARNLYVEGTYDRLNRITLRNYSDSAMPDVTFYYDGTGLGGVPNYSKGKTTRVTSSVSETKNMSFDIMGRLLTYRQTTDGTDYDTAYTYNLSGALIEETYPSTRVVRNTLDADGQLFSGLRAPRIQVQVIGRMQIVSPTIRREP